MHKHIGLQSCTSLSTKEEETFIHYERANKNPNFYGHHPVAGPYPYAGISPQALRSTARDWVGGHLNYLGAGYKDWVAEPTYHRPAPYLLEVAKGLRLAPAEVAVVPLLPHNGAALESESYGRVVDEGAFSAGVAARVAATLECRRRRPQRSTVEFPVPRHSSNRHYFRVGHISE